MLAREAEEEEDEGVVSRLQAVAESVEIAAVVVVVRAAAAVEGVSTLSSSSV